MFAIIPSVALRNEYWVELSLLSISHISHMIKKMAKKFATSAKAKKRIAKISFDGRQLIFEKSLLENQISSFF